MTRSQESHISFDGVKEGLLLRLWRPGPAGPREGESSVCATARSAATRWLLLENN